MSPVEPLPHRVYLHEQGPRRKFPWRAVIFGVLAANLSLNLADKYLGDDEPSAATLPVDVPFSPAAVINDDDIYINGLSPIGNSLTLAAREFTGDATIAADCIDTTAFDDDPDDDFVPVGVYIPGERTKSGNPFIGIDGVHCDVLGNVAEVEMVPIEIQKALFVVSHEFAHGKGESNETQASCDAEDLYPEVAAYFGMSEYIEGSDPAYISRTFFNDEGYHDFPCE